MLVLHALCPWKKRNFTDSALSPSLRCYAATVFQQKHQRSTTVGCTPQATKGSAEVGVSSVGAGQLSQTPRITVRTSAGLAGNERPLETSTLLQARTARGGDTGALTESAAGLKTGPELAEMWSPSVAFGQTTPSDTSRQSSRLSMLSHSVHTSNVSSPMSNSTTSSTLHTPGPATATATSAFTFSHKTSPTPSVSVDTESMRGHQLPSLTQSAVHFEDSVGSTQFDPLSKSVIVEGTCAQRLGGASSRGSSSSVKMSQAHRTDKDGQMTQSFRVKIDKFIGIFSSRKRTDSATSADSEDFTEIFVSDASTQGEGASSRRMLGRSASLEALRETAGGRQGGRWRTISIDEESKPEEDMHQGTLFEVEQEEREEEEEGGEEGEGVQEASAEAQDGTSTASPSVSSERPESDRHMDMTLGVYGDSRRFSHSGAVRGRNLGSDEMGTALRASLFSSSFPGRSPVMERKSVSRSRTSCSEADTDHTMFQVKDRLQKLVESPHTISEDLTDSASLSVTPEENPLNLKDEEWPKPREQGHVRQHPALHMVSSVDSTTTLVGSCPSQPSGSEHPDGGPKSRLLMRRVSVCGRQGPSMNESSSNGVIMGEWPSSQATPSPVYLLDQFVAHGEVLHRGSPEDIPLSELEGTDWYFFGGCPHSEEVQMMQSQVALLHSQLLFERHQCLQHARRSRRLLSKARSGIQVTQELVQLVRTCICLKLAQLEGKINVYQKHKHIAPSFSETCLKWSLC